MAHQPMYCSNDDGDDCTKDDANMRKGLPALGARFFALEPLFKQVATLRGARGIALPCPLVSPYRPVGL